MYEKYAKNTIRKLTFFLYVNSTSSVAALSWINTEIIHGGDVALRAVSCSLGLSGGAI